MRCWTAVEEVARHEPVRTMVVRSSTVAIAALAKHMSVGDWATAGRTAEVCMMCIVKEQAAVAG